MILWMSRGAILVRSPFFLSFLRPSFSPWGGFYQLSYLKGKRCYGTLMTLKVNDVVTQPGKRCCGTWQLITKT